MSQDFIPKFAHLLREQVTNTVVRSLAWAMRQLLEQPSTREYPTTRRDAASVLHDKRPTAAPTQPRGVGAPPTFSPIMMLVPLGIHIDHDHSTLYYSSPSQMEQWMQSLPTTSIDLFVGLSN